MIIAAAVGLLLAGTVALWAHYGTAVFFEMIAPGIAACLERGAAQSGVRHDRAQHPRPADDARHFSPGWCCAWA